MLGNGSRLTYLPGMPGESPRERQALVAAVERSKLHHRIWGVFCFVVIAVVMLGWALALNRLYWSIPHDTLSVAIGVSVWLLSLPVVLTLAVIVLRFMERLFVSSSDRELRQES